MMPHSSKDQYRSTALFTVSHGRKGKNPCDCCLPSGVQIPYPPLISPRETGGFFHAVS